MRAFVITGPGRAEVQEAEPPAPGTGEVVVEVERAGVCGTDMEFFTGAMAYLRTGEARYPMRIGHEWAGVVREVGDGVDRAWLGRRVTGDTMLGCGRCARCTAGRQHLCADRHEIGIRNGWPGALAERLPVPVRALQPLPGPVDPVLGALVEPGGNALRAVRAAALQPGERLLVIGPGTIGLLAAMIAAAQGAEVHLLGLTERSLGFARSLGFTHLWTMPPHHPGPGTPESSAATTPEPGTTGPNGPIAGGPAWPHATVPQRSHVGGLERSPAGPPERTGAGAVEEAGAGAPARAGADVPWFDTAHRPRFDAVIDASTGAGSPALAFDVVEPGRRVVFIGLSAEPSLADTRRLVLKDVTAVGVLSASGGLAGAVDLYASGAVDPRPLVAATVPLEEAAAVLAGKRRPEWGDAPKILIDPRLT
ncbi:zinc-binding dehydrogenase [Nonomuraea sp. NPDC049480]|uniref:zinc-binding dehydrogenase n=1 Tax=Nonomuraea sp. NPDC049480 TaxID=3364353 RepID=UPI0037A959BB